MGNVYLTAAPGFKCVFPQTGLLRAFDPFRSIWQDGPMNVARSMVALVRLGLVAVAITACATGGDSPSPSASFTTLMPGWESKFSVEWKVAPGKDGSHLLYGRVTSRYGQYAEPMLLLGQALDTSEQVVNQRVERVPGGVPGFNSTYFEINRLAAADHYKVTVWAYTLIEERGLVQ